MDYICEDNAPTLKEQKYVKDQIVRLVSYQTIVDGKENNIHDKLIFPLINGKDHNTVTITTSKMRSYLCLATSKQFNKLDKFQSDMFNNMSIFVLTYIHKIFVHFFGIGSVASYFLCLKLLLDLKMRKKKERQTFRPHMGALFSAINSKINSKFL